ncbi:uncharacterized protein [Dendrobates tinctorius]|uniref:uncharacterized protein n=1 Tax=Dendrobates tinctorius TaxID=92724 RepID=UPI003CC93801
MSEGEDSDASADCAQGSCDVTTSRQLGESECRPLKWHRHKSCRLILPVLPPHITGAAASYYRSCRLILPELPPHITGAAASYYRSCRLILPELPPHITGAAASYYRSCRLILPEQPPHITGAAASHYRSCRLILPELPPHITQMTQTPLEAPSISPITRTRKKPPPCHYCQRHPCNGGFPARARPLPGGHAPGNDVTPGRRSPHCLLPAAPRTSSPGCGSLRCQPPIITTPKTQIPSHHPDFSPSDEPDMDEDESNISRRIIDFTSEIISLLSGEDYTIEKKTSGDCVTPIIHLHVSGGGSSNESPITEAPHSPMPEKILDLTTEITELLTGELPATKKGGERIRGCRDTIGCHRTVDMTGSADLGMLKEPRLKNKKDSRCAGGRQVPGGLREECGVAERRAGGSS